MRIGFGLAAALALAATVANAQTQAAKGDDFRPVIKQVTRGPDTIVDSVSYNPISFLPMHIGGRVRKEALGYRYQWPGVYFEARFKSPFVNMMFDDDANNFNVIIDGKPLMTVYRPGHTTINVEASGPGPHTIRLEKRSETQYATGHFQGFMAEPAAVPAPARARQIEFIGDSLSVGYGNTSAYPDCTKEEVFETTNTQQAFGPLTAKHFDADYQVNAFSGLGMVRNYGGYEHPNYHMPMLYPRAIFDDPAPDASDAAAGWSPQVVFITLGGNDFSSQLTPGEPWKTRDELVKAYEDAYVAFVKTLRIKYPKALIVLDSTQEYPEYKPSVDQVFAMLKAAGISNIDRLALDVPPRTSCGHPNTRADAQLAQQMIGYLDAHPQVWQGK